MTVTVVIPVVELRENARKCLIRMCEDVRKATGTGTETLCGLSFTIACARHEDEQEVRDIFKDFPLHCNIISLAGANANELRSVGKDAKTDFVFMQDCDDEADYSEIVRIAGETRSKEVVVCMNAVVCRDGKEEKVFRNMPEGEISDIRKLPKQWWGKLIPTHFLREIEFPEMKFAQDWFPSIEMWLKHRHIFMDATVYRYIKNDNSLADPKEDSARELMLTQSVINSQMFRLGKLLKQEEYDFVQIMLTAMLRNRLKRFNLGREMQNLSFKRLVKQDLRTQLRYLRMKTGMS